MDELLCDLPYNRRQRVRGRELVHGLRERDEDGGDAELMVGEVFHDVCVESEHAELVTTHDTREELHDEDLVVKREAFVVLVEDIVEFLAERLGIMKKLNSGEVRVGFIGFLLLFLFMRSVRRVQPKDSDDLG